MNPSDTYNIHNADMFDTPFLAVYPEVVRQNIENLIRLLPDKNRIRPHVKTHKSPQVIKLLLEAGIIKFKCATIAEADMCAKAGATDVLLAYQPVGPKIPRFISLTFAYPNCRFSCLVDNESIAGQLSIAAGSMGKIAEIWLDLNTGMNRTGVKPGDDSRKLFEVCRSLPGLKIRGLHAYDGHITTPHLDERLAEAAEAFARVTEFADELVRSGYETPEIVAGSSPTLQYFAGVPGVECSPGSFIYWDRHYETFYSELGFKQAAMLVARVISTPDKNRICLDAGYKAVSSEGPPEERVYLPDLPHAKVIAQSEEHLLMDSGNRSLQVGELVYAVPFHIGRTINFYESSFVVEDNQVRGTWLHTARWR